MYNTCRLSALERIYSTNQTAIRVCIPCLLVRYTYGVKKNQHKLDKRENLWQVLESQKPLSGIKCLGGLYS
jgi:hypothetical protein